MRSRAGTTLLTALLLLGCHSSTPTEPTATTAATTTPVTDACQVLTPAEISAVLAIPIDPGQHIPKTSTIMCGWPKTGVTGDSEVVLNFTTPDYFGKERDAESGLDYFGARYYGSSMGRWMSPDPSMESEILELPQTWNRYSYVYNRPTYATDPDGRCPPCVAAIVGGVVGGLAEGGWNLGSQLVSNHGDLSAVHWGDVGANALGGLAAGALAGATGGGSLLADAAIGAGANAVGGIVTRTAQGGDASEVFSASDVSTDALVGFVGGGAGHIAADVVHVPEDPGPRPKNNGHRRLEKWKANTADRNLKIGGNVGIGTAYRLPIRAHGTTLHYVTLELVHVRTATPAPAATLLHHERK